MKGIIINSPTHGNKIAFVDDEDYEYLNQWKWQVKKHRKTYYAHRTKQVYKNKKDHFKMHRVIMKITDPGIEIDHIDHNGLNCQKNNLRIATRKQNKQNASSHKNSSSQYLGVIVYTSKLDGRKIFCAQIGVNGKSTHIGTFKSELEAAKAYDEAAKKHYGEFANPNFK